MYDFSILKDFLDTRKFPKAKSHFKLKTTDFQKAFKEGKIKFRDDGAYLIDGNKEYRGYWFLAEYNIEKWKKEGAKNPFPKFHLTDCKTIEELGDSLPYKWSNAKTQDIYCKDSKKTIKDKTLHLCWNCRKEISGNIATTEEFYNSLDKSTIEEKQEVDINGYPIKWEQISKYYREKQKYTCEKCGFKPLKKMDNRFIETHHKDSDKLNNKESNLQCLCVLCHSKVDERHKYNFSKGANKIRLESFLYVSEEYHNKLYDLIESKYEDIFKDKIKLEKNKNNQKKGEIDKILNDNEKGKNGFIKSDNDSYYFTASINFHLTAKLNIGTRVIFEVITEARRTKKEKAKIIKIIK